jgi:hypothetical protein
MIQRTVPITLNGKQQHIRSWRAGCPHASGAQRRMRTGSEVGKCLRVAANLIACGVACNPGNRRALRFGSISQGRQPFYREADEMPGITVARGSSNRCLICGRPPRWEDAVTARSRSGMHSRR